jgi:hypothetical protein
VQHDPGVTRDGLRQHPSIVRVAPCDHVSTGWSTHPIGTSSSAIASTGSESPQRVSDAVPLCTHGQCHAPRRPPASHVMSMRALLRQQRACASPRSEQQHAQPLTLHRSIPKTPAMVRRRCRHAQRASRKIRRCSSRARTLLALRVRASVASGSRVQRTRRHTPEPPIQVAAMAARVIRLEAVAEAEAEEKAQCLQSTVQSRL